MVQARPALTPADVDGRLVVVTPWYPTAENPYGGAFVRETTRALLGAFPDPLVVHVEVRALDAAPVEPSLGVVDGLEVFHLTAPMDPMTPRHRVAELVRDALAPYAPVLAAAAVLHVHVGMPTGWAVLDLVGDRTRVVVSEHASYLNKLWSVPQSEAMYARTVRGAALVTAVGEDTTRAVQQRYPEVADKVHTVPNPVDVERFAPRELPPTNLHRWLYVGNLLEAKGVLRLVRAFAAWHAQRPTATLTVAGGGVDADRVRALADELGVGAAVRLVGRVAPAQVGALYQDADVLVHLSVSETFGLTAVEALASELPVVATATRGGTRTLDVAQDEDMARLVPVGDGVEDVIAAVRELEERRASARPGLVRADLAVRFGTRPVGDVLAAALRGEPVDEPDPDAPLVVAVALHGSALPGAVRVVRDAVRRGARAVLIADGADRLELDRRVQRLDVAPIRAGLLSHRLEGWVLDGVPRALIGATRPVARRAGRERVVDAALQRQQRLSTRWKTAVGGPGHARIDPGALARVVTREAGPLVAGAALVTWGHVRGRPLAERIAAGSPGAVVVQDADLEVVSRVVQRA